MSADRLRELVAEATDGPWAVDDRGSSIEIESAVALVAEIDASYDVQFDRVQCEADARLIALAPEMATRLADAWEVLDELTQCPNQDAPYHSGCSFCAAPPVEQARDLIRRLSALLPDEKGVERETP